jgi:hypothetical protein
VGSAFCQLGSPWWGNSVAPCSKFRTERKFPPPLRLIREKEISITVCSTDRLIADPDLPISFDNVGIWARSWEIRPDSMGVRSSSASTPDRRFKAMLFINRLVVIGLLSVGITAATTAQAGVQLFTAEWYSESFGNEFLATTGNASWSTTMGSAPHCTRFTPDFTRYAITGVPLGIQCNDVNPRCPLSSTPVTAMGKWHPLGGKGQPTNTSSFNCGALSTYGSGITVRPAKGGTAQGPTGPPNGTAKPFRIPPVYRNPGFFTPNGQPNRTLCSGFSTGAWTSTQTRFGKNKGLVQKGNPVAGSWNAATTGGPLGGFTFAPAPATGSLGFRVTSGVGQVANTYPYIYSYTYADLRNDQGTFGPGQGPGNFNIVYGGAGSPLASINVKQGAAKFGGTMKMLGALTTKVCYWLRAGGGGCSLGVMDWRYEAIGAPTTTTANGAPILPITMGRIYTNYTRYYNTAKGSYSAVTAAGSRFPWTTGAVTVTAVARGPHKTIHYAHGYDNRITTGSNIGKGTIQLVSPVLTRWDGFTKYETGGIAVLRIKFIPEPQTWAMLVAGASLLAVGARLRRR